MAGGAADLPTDSKKEVRGPVSQTGSADLSLLQELFERLGHLVGTGDFIPQRIPSMRWIASCTGIPFSRLEMPWRFPLHPPVTCTDWMIPSSAWISNCRAHTPLG